MFLVASAKAEVFCFQTSKDCRLEYFILLWPVEENTGHGVLLSAKTCEGGIIKLRINLLL